MEKFEFYGAPDIDKEMTQVDMAFQKPEAVKTEGTVSGFWDKQFDQLQERMSGAERQILLHRIRQKQRGKQTPSKDDKKSPKGKLPSWGRRK